MRERDIAKFVEFGGVCSTNLPVAMSFIVSAVYALFAFALFLSRILKFRVEFSSAKGTNGRGWKTT